MIGSFVKHSSFELLFANLTLHSSPHINADCIVVLGNDLILEPLFETMEVNKHGTVAWTQLHVLDLITWYVVKVTVLADFFILLALEIMRGWFQWCWVMLEKVLDILQLIVDRMSLIWVCFNLNYFVLDSAKFY